MVVAEVALIGADWREIGDAIVASVVVFCAAVGRTKQHPKDARVDKIGYMAQDIFGAVMYDFLSSAPRFTTSSSLVRLVAPIGRPQSLQSGAER